MLTKEECLKALKKIEQEFGCDMAYYGLEGERDLLFELVNEHFDNPPLKFEEINEGMVVWDNDLQEYLIISRKIHLRGEERFVARFKYGETIEYYEEDRFFRREVQE